MDILKWLLTACIMLAFMALGLDGERKNTPDQDDSASLVMLTQRA